MKNDMDYDRLVEFWFDCYSRRSDQLEWHLETLAALPDEERWGSLGLAQQGVITEAQGKLQHAGRMLNLFQVKAKAAKANDQKSPE